MATLFEQLDSMRQLGENWDGYKAATPLPEAIDLAKEFVDFLTTRHGGEFSELEMFVTPSRDGGVLVEWNDLHNEHELEINPDGSLGFLHTDKVTGQLSVQF